MHYICLTEHFTFTRLRTSSINISKQDKSSSIRGFRGLKNCETLGHAVHPKTIEINKPVVATSPKHIIPSLVLDISLSMLLDVRK